MYRARGRVTVLVALNIVFELFLRAPVAALSDTRADDVKRVVRGDAATLVVAWES